MSFQNCKLSGVGINPTDYHNITQLRGARDFPISPSSLKAFTVCPSRWKAGYESPDSKSKTYGGLFDCLLLTPKQFDARYILQPETYRNEKGEAKPWSNNSNVCKAWNEEQRSAGVEIVKSDDLVDCDAAIKRLMSDSIIAGWHTACETQLRCDGEWVDDGPGGTGLAVPVRCLIDYAPRKGTEFDGCLGDLKTSKSGNLRYFGKQVYDMGWHIQAAFDLALYNAATGEERDTWCFIGQENYSPWEPFRRMLDPDFLAIGREQFQTALRMYCKCLHDDRWPNYDEMNENNTQGWSVVYAEPYMTFAAEGDRMRAIVDAELTQEEKLERAGLGVVQLPHPKG